MNKSRKSSPHCCLARAVNVRLNREQSGERVCYVCRHTSSEMSLICREGEGISGEEESTHESVRCVFIIYFFLGFTAYFPSRFFTSRINAMA